MRCLFSIQPDSAVILTMANVGVASMIFAKKDANKSLSTKTHHFNLLNCTELNFLFHH